jgi:hypothetical protein
MRRIITIKDFQHPRLNFLTINAQEEQEVVPFRVVVMGEILMKVRIFPLKKVGILILSFITIMHLSSKFLITSRNRSPLSLVSIGKYVSSDYFIII